MTAVEKADLVMAHLAENVPGGWPSRPYVTFDMSCPAAVELGRLCGERGATIAEMPCDPGKVFQAGHFDQHGFYSVAIEATAESLQ